MKHLALALALHSLVPVAAAQGSCAATLAEYDAVELWIKYEQVVEIVGCSGREVSRIQLDLDGTAIVEYRWEGNGQALVNIEWKGMTYSVGVSLMKVEVVNGLVVSKKQLNLR